MTNYVDYDRICTAAAVDTAILEDINKHTKDKHLISLGCAEGDFEKTIDCAGFTGVDPFSKTEKILKKDGL